MELLVIVLAARDLDRSVDEERAEKEEHPGEPLDERRADKDEHAAQHERNRDADRQHEFLQLLRHREIQHDDDEHEQVVDAQRILGEPSRIELDRGLRTRDPPDEPTEDERHPDEERDVPDALLRRRHMRAPAEDEEVDDEEDGEHNIRADHEREGCFCHRHPAYGASATVCGSWAVDAAHDGRRSPGTLSAWPRSSRAVPS